MNPFTHYSEHVGMREGKHFKATVAEGEHLFVGMNCLEPGQSQHPHTHDSADKVYVVMEGEGLFTVGETQQTAGPGMIVWAAAGVPHGVENRGETRLVLLVGITPPPGGK